MVENKKPRKTVLTPGKKAEEYEVKRKGSTHFSYIVNKNGGAVPTALSGVYTSEAFASTGIQSYLSKRRKGE